MSQKKKKENMFSVYQDYMNKYFRVPEDVRNDIVYCQRVMKDYLEVRELLLATFQQRKDVSGVQKQRILEEINDELFRINAEQQSLFFELRRKIDDFVELVKKDNVPIDRSLVEMAVSRAVVPLINDKSIVLKPTEVEARPSATDLMQRYLKLLDQTTQVFEIIDSDDEDSANVTNKRKKQQQKKDDDVVLISDKSLKRSTSLHSHKTANKQQVSLLKPISERNMLHQNAVGHDGHFTDPQQFLQVELIEEKINNNKMPPAVDVNVQTELVSKNVSLSRMNLRKALNKAKEAAVGVIARPLPPLVAISPAASQATTQASLLKSSNTAVAVKAGSSAAQQQAQAKQAQATAAASVAKMRVLKKNETKKATRGAIAAAQAEAAAAAAADAYATDANTSSEDSNHDVTPPDYQDLRHRPEVTINTTLPEHVGKEMFLRMLCLYTPDQIQQLQQRRSKRKRRNVQKNERADYLYGRIDYGNAQPEKKKRRAFLVSPQLKRGLQQKAQKRASVDKITEETNTSRSNSSSPHAKRICVVCLKQLGAQYENCTECLAYYHVNCHDEKYANCKDANKLCPNCLRKIRRLENDFEMDSKLLTQNAEAWNATMQNHSKRQMSLQQESINFKIQMTNIFNIVKTVNRTNVDAANSD